MGLFRRSKRSANAVAGDVAAIPVSPSTAWMAQSAAPTSNGTPTATATPTISANVAAAAPPMPIVTAPIVTAPIATAPIASAPTASPVAAEPTPTVAAAPMFSYGDASPPVVTAAPRIETPAPTPAPPAPPALALATSPTPPAPTSPDVTEAAGAIAAYVAGELSEIVARIEHLEAANTRLRATVDQVTAANDELLANVDVATAANIELLATVHRLEARLDTPLDAPPVDAPAIATVDDLAEIRAGQVRLANEQARYEIAFRADLADIAERFRRSA